MLALETHASTPPAADASLDQRVETACSRIAPTWPLDRLIAVNPCWGFVEQPVQAASAKLGSLCGTRLLMPRSWYLGEWHAGRIHASALEEAKRESGLLSATEVLVAALGHERSLFPRCPTMLDWADDQTPSSSARVLTWREYVVHSLSQACASYFSQRESARVGSEQTSLFAAWLSGAKRDRSPELMMGCEQYRSHLATWSGEARTGIESVTARLGIPPEHQADYFTALLLDVGGWAAWCAYRRFTARQRNEDDDAIVDLLAMRLSWESVLYEQAPLAARAQLRTDWGARLASVARAIEEERVDWIWQRAAELAFQAPLRHALVGPRAKPLDPPRIQAVFCIDVRSEILRRGLEATSGDTETIGFAGFFGLPAEYIAFEPERSGVASAAEPRLPGPLSPRLRIADTNIPDAAAGSQIQTLRRHRDWKTFRGASAVAGFAAVETTGLAYGVKLLAGAMGVSERAPDVHEVGLSVVDRARRKPRVVGVSGGGSLSFAARCELAAGILRAMNLTTRRARLIALVGHGSATTNNAHAASLDCGACGGHAGDVNARAAASLLNEPAVREGLVDHGIAIPDTTHFVPGLHNTTTDEIALFDLDEVPPTHRDDVDALTRQLHMAGTTARCERAPRLGLGSRSESELLEALRARTRDFSEVRPEWALANNAAFIAAPRSRTKSFSLEGRSFLHEYEASQDPKGAVLELIMTAPMVVAHWINFQYYASTVDNVRFGSGNKVLHNVVGGHLGVFEGNGGDLRIGLPLQSIHDGSTWMHTPLRLSVFLEAPIELIEQVLRKHDTVRHLVDGEWIFLFQIDAVTGVTRRRRADGWSS